MLSMLVILRHSAWLADFEQPEVKSGSQAEPPSQVQLLGQSQGLLLDECYRTFYQYSLGPDQQQQFRAKRTSLLVLLTLIEALEYKDVVTSYTLVQGSTVSRLEKYGQR